jgi:ketosteroid isomerase-like protein
MSTNRDAFAAAIAAWNGGDLDRYLELYDESIRLHGYSPEPMDKPTVQAFYQGIWAAVERPQLEVHTVLEDGDTLAVHATMTGRHVGELLGVPATGTDIHLPVMTMLRFRDGRVVERWSVSDFLAVMSQIGALPAPT